MLGAPAAAARPGLLPAAVLSGRQQPAEAAAAPPVCRAPQVVAGFAASDSCNELNRPWHPAAWNRPAVLCILCGFVCLCASCALRV
jgi:hypothetical protein